MSNRQVAGVYRQVIDSVIQNSRADFEEMGFEDSVLSALQKSWESKLASARVADFETDARLGPLAREAATQALQARQRLLAQQQKDAASAASSSAPSPAHQADIKANNKSSGTTTPMTNKSEEDKEEDNLIGSDLDDSDDEDDNKAELDDSAAGGDLVIALYEKVTRVKNKWKVQLKDGIVSANGKDYLFSKCNGEFEW